MRSTFVAVVGLLLSAGVASAALPYIDAKDVAFVQSAKTKVVTIEYKLSAAPAIVTMEVLTNGVAVSDRVVNTGLSGAVNRLVRETGVSQQIVWDAATALPGVAFASGEAELKLSAWATNTPPEYMVIDLTGTPGENLEFYVSADAIPFGGVTNDLYKTTKLVMKKVHAANVEARLGAMSNELGQPGNSASQNSFEDMRIVSFSEDFYLAIYETTNAQYTNGTGKAATCLFTNPEAWATRPTQATGFGNLRGNRNTEGEMMHKVTAASVIGAFRAKTGGLVQFDLPTVAQWEFTFRAGTSSAFYNGAELYTATGGTMTNSLVDALGRYYHNAYPAPGEENYGVEKALWTASSGTAKVGSYPPNPWGFYDMFGNLSECCLDVDGGRLKASPVRDPFAANSTSNDTYWEAKGGNWNQHASGQRASSRNYQHGGPRGNGDGFRLWAPVGLVISDN